MGESDGSADHWPPVSLWRSTMPDYHALIARAVSRLEQNTPKARQDLYEQARAILSDQLRKRQPLASDSEIRRERAVLDEAIRKVESEIATKSTSHAGSISAPSANAAGKSQVRAFEQEAVASGPSRGRITFSQGQRPVIELGETADASTAIYLLAHAWLEELMEDAEHPRAPDSLRQDARTVLKWLGVAKPEAIETKHHDQFARAIERYVMEGQAPAGELAPAFAAYSEWLSKIYATPPSLNVPLNDDIRGVLNRLLAMPGETENWTADRARAAIAPEQSPGPPAVRGQTSDPVSQQRSTQQRQPPVAPPPTTPTGQGRQSELLYWSERIGCGATIKLRSNEICAVSIARWWVLVKSSPTGRFRRFSVGFFAPVLYSERNASKVAATVFALDELFPEKKVPVTFRNPILSAYANAIWQCSTTAEVAITLNEAIAKAEVQAKSDEKIVGDLADMMASGETKPDAYYDVSVLPYPKETILRAIEREIIREPLDVRVELLKVGAVFLTSFQEGIGLKPLYLLGVDFAKLQSMTPDLMRRIKAVVENTDVERVRRSAELKKIDGDRILARMNAAVRLRNARLGAASGNVR
jgi:hypothetical protein